jgi:signal transduction histidine kinase
LYAIRKNGNEFPVEVSLSHYEQDNAFFVIAFVIDITQRKETEYKILQQKDELEKITNDMRKLNADLENKVQKRTMILQEALQQLEQSREELSQALSKERELSEIKSRFVSMASHEFRTPLSTVLSSASLLSKYTLSEQQENREKHIRRIKDSVKHLNDLLEDFLSLGKLEENKIDVQSAPFEVATFMDEVLEEIRVVLKKDQQIIPVYTGGVRFTTDKRLLKNILINLLTNASKFSDEGKCIYLSADTGGERLEVKIKDEGIGIGDDDQVHLFSSFYRGKNAVNIQGTGLGLHIVKRYTELLEGAIFLKSALGQGTEVVLSLPLLPESIDEGKKTFYSY